MRLYLSSFRVGDCPERLTALMRRPGPVAVIANSMDAAPPDVRADGVALEQRGLAALGLDAVEVDLRTYVGEPDRVAADLAEYELVWVRGGNVFVLRHALAVSGADAALVELLAADALVFGGYSAGPCILGPTLRGLEHCDPVSEVAQAYGAEARFDGLGVLDEVFVPHVDSPGHPESDLLGEVAAHYRATGVAHRTLRDGQVWVVDGDSSLVCG